MRWRRSSLVLIFISVPLSPEPSALLGLGACLSCLLLQHFARVADTLLLIRVRLAQAADVGGDLADELPVDAGHRDVRLLFDSDLDSAGNVEHDRVRVAEGENHLLAL